MAITAQVFSLMAQRKQDNLLKFLVETGSPDTVFAFPSLGTGVEGSQNVAALLARTLKCIPDFALAIRGHEVLDARNIKVHFGVSGTQREEHLPFFPLHRAISWECTAFVHFDKLGRVRRNHVHFTFVPDTVLEPSIVEGLAQTALSLATTSTGSRLLQDAIEAAQGSDRSVLAERLRGAIWEATISPHGHHVLQKLVVVLPPERVHFIVQELKGKAVLAAENRFGCRVLERLIEHCKPEQIADLAEEITECGLELSRHPFGNYVVQHLLQYGTPEQQRRLADVLSEDVRRLARHRIASNVVRAAITYCSAEDRRRLTEAVCDPREKARLARHLVGSFVVREVKLTAKQGSAAAAG